MKRLYQLITEQQFTRCHKQEKYKKLLFRAVFLPQRVVGKEEVSYAGLEHSVWL